MKYLLSEAHGIGDCILILPVAKAIKKADPGAEVVVFTSSNKSKIKINEGIMSLQHYVDSIEYYSAAEKWHSIKFLVKNMMKRYDYGIVVQDYDTPETSTIPSHIVRLCAKKTCGTRITNRPSIKYDFYIEREEGIKRDELFIRALQELGIKTKKDQTSLLDKYLVNEKLPEVSLRDDLKTIAIVLGTAPVLRRTEKGVLSNNSKEWPYEYWKELVDRLAKQYNVILLGGPKELKDIESLNITFGCENIYNLAGKYPIAQSIAILSLADIVVGADTGLMHCAGALEKPTVTLFGCTDYKEYLPFGKKSEYVASTADCSPCFGSIKAVTCKDKKCMRLISVDTIENKIKETINKYL